MSMSLFFRDLLRFQRSISGFFNSIPPPNRIAALTIFFSCIAPNLLAVTVRVEPSNPCAAPRQTRQFHANVAGTANRGVTWYINGIRSGNSAVGTINAAGEYTAPLKIGRYYVTARSQASPGTLSGSTVKVTSSSSCPIIPDSSALLPSAQQAFHRPVNTSGQTDWTVDNIPGGNSTVGTITTGGIYTAPATPGTHTVALKNLTQNTTSVADIAVYSSIIADFGSRTDHAHPVAPYIFGYGRGEAIRTVADRQAIGQAGVTVARLYAQIDKVYATRTPDWSSIDRYLSAVQAAGQHLILQMSYTPAWLQPNPNPCGRGNKSVGPSDVRAWANIAVAYVNHIDHAYPNLVQDYEIWNEPDTGGLCASNHLKTYMAIYAAAAPAMRAQAVRDGKSIRVGGPALAGYDSAFLSAFLSSSSTAPFVDFVSYHEYLLGDNNLSDPWLSSSGGTSLYKQTQDVNLGAAATYKKIYAAVKAGKQPLGARTPIYITEFNTNWAFAKDCCKNDPTYAPLWNALYISDVLNTAYSGVALPKRMVYFAGNASPYFCLIGTVDKNMDCSYGSNPKPYPAYYAYRLISSASYLGLVNGGYMATYVNPPTDASGLVVTAFYNVNQDAVLILNPTGNNYTGVKVDLKNVGYSNPRATRYEIMHGNSIFSSSIGLGQSGSTYSTTLDVPAHSVQAISVKAQ